MDAWEKLIEKSTLSSGDAWERLNTQGGSGGASTSSQKVYFDSRERVSKIVKTIVINN